MYFITLKPNITSGLLALTEFNMELAIQRFALNFQNYIPKLFITYTIWVKEKSNVSLLGLRITTSFFFCYAGQCPWLDCHSIRTAIESCKSFFPVIQYAVANVPTYPCGQIGFIMCSRNSVRILDDFFM